MFDSLRGMAGLAGIMKDLPRIKAKLEEVKAEISAREVQASTGGGAVTAFASGRLRIVRIEFDHALLGAIVEGDSDEDRALAADLVTGACNAAGRPRSRPSNVEPPLLEPGAPLEHRWSGLRPSRSPHRRTPRRPR